MVAKTRNDLIGPMPPALRTFKSPDNYGAAELPGPLRAYLVWSELVGQRLVVVFHHAHPGRKTFVGIPTPQQRTFEELVAIPPLAPEDVPFSEIDLDGDDDTLANRVAIRTAERWAMCLRERRRGLAPAPARRTGRRRAVNPARRPEAGGRA